MIYKSFFKKKVTKIYVIIFIIFSLVFSYLYISKNDIIKQGNKAYANSYIVFSSSKDIDLSKEKSIEKYNKALEFKCSNKSTILYTTKEKPLITDIDSEDKEKEACLFNEYTIEYDFFDDIKWIENSEIYDIVSREQKDITYIATLNNWFETEIIIDELAKKYDVKIEVNLIEIDDINYEHIIFIHGLFTKILIILFVILLLISMVNIILDEKKNNNLYYSLGYSRLKISILTINKILLVITIPLFIFISSIIITSIIK